jgi:hypothetical protein
MSTVAAVVFSFVFTTSANAQSVENSQKNNLGIRVKAAPNGKQKNNLGIRVKAAPNGKQKNNLGVRVKTTPNENKQNGQGDFADSIVQMFQNVFGVRV